MQSKPRLLSFNFFINAARAKQHEMYFDSKLFKANQKMFAPALLQLQ
jgi:hypothetical protein